MARNIKDRTNAEPVDGVNLYGRIADESAPLANDGTPVNDASEGDAKVFFQRLMAMAGITPNELPDDATNGFQIWEAFDQMIKNQKYTRMMLVDGSDLFGEVQGAFFGGGVWVVVDSNEARWSKDGLTWNTVSVTAKNWSGVVGAKLGGGASYRFVAVGKSTGDTVMTSDDLGQTWTDRTPSTTTVDWWDIAFSDGLTLFVAVGDDSQEVMSSPDGITWTDRSSPAGEFRKIAAGNSSFVAVSVGGATRIMSSANGTTWTARTPSELNDVWEGIAYGNGRYVAVSSDGTNRIIYSDDEGVTWNTANTFDETTFAPRDLVFGNGVFICVGTDTTNDVQYYTSVNGIDWIAVKRQIVGWDEGSFQSVGKGAYGNGMFLFPLNFNNSIDAPRLVLVG